MGVLAMANLSIRNLPDPTVAALKARAFSLSVAGARVSVEALVRDILVEATRSKEKGMGSQLAAIGQRLGGIDIKVERSPSMIRPAHFD